MKAETSKVEQFMQICPAYEEILGTRMNIRRNTRKDIENIEKQKAKDQMKKIEEQNKVNDIKPKEKKMNGEEREER